MPNVYRRVGAFWLSTGTEPRLIGRPGGRPRHQGGPKSGPTEGKDDMGKRFAIVIGAAALGAAVMAAGASADFRSVHDPRGDTRCYHEQSAGISLARTRMRRNADIVRATAGHDGQRLRHTIRVVGKFHAATLLINTDSDPDCEWSVVRQSRCGQARGPGVLQGAAASSAARGLTSTATRSRSSSARGRSETPQATAGAPAPSLAPRTGMPSIPFLTTDLGRLRSHTGWVTAARLRLG